MSVPRYWRQIPERYTLQASRCGVCKRVAYPPRRICPVCRRDSLDKMRPVHLAGRARVVHATRVHRPAAGYEDHVPYWIALLETPEGPRLIGQLVEVDAVEVEPGLVVEATFRRLGADGASGVIHYGMKWRPASDPVAWDEEE